MSEAEKILTAERAGRRAYWSGLPVTENRFRASDSRRAFEQAWKQEEQHAEIMRCRSVDQGIHRHCMCGSTLKAHEMPAGCCMKCMDKALESSDE